MERQKKKFHIPMEAFDFMLMFMGSNVSMKGFRPGKLPKEILRYKTKDKHQEVLNMLVEQNLYMENQELSKTNQTMADVKLEHMTTSPDGGWDVIVDYYIIDLEKNNRTQTSDNTGEKETTTEPESVVDNETDS